MKGMNRADRLALGWIARRLFSRRVAQYTLDDGPDRLLLVRVDERVGNMITLQSIMDAISSNWPSCKLGLLCSNRMEQVVSKLDGLHLVHALDKRWFFKHHARWRRVIGECRRARYEVAVDASAWHEFSFTHAALAYYSGAPVRIGYEREANLSGFHTHLVKPGPSDEHELAQRMRLLAPLGLHVPPPQLRTRLGMESVGKFSKWLQSLKVNAPRIGIWAGGRKQERRWPVPFYVQLARSLQQKFGATIIILWGPGEDNIREALAFALPLQAVAAPKTDLDELAGLMRNLDLVVTNDTGPMHLSVACATSTVSLFASGEPRRWGHPYSFVRNVFCPGQDPQEIKMAMDACTELLTK